MKKLEFVIPESEQIDINGDVFEIHKSDIDILNKSAELTEKYGNLTKSKNAKNIALLTAGANEIISYIDEILGEGAVAKISRGKPVGIVTACNLLTAICGEINKSNDEYIDKKYE